MALQALIVCRDPKTVSILKRALAHLQIGSQVGSNFDQALELAAQQKFEAIIIDANPRRSAEFLSDVREVTRHKMVVSVILNGSRTVRDAFEMGANFVLYAPLTLERALHGMQAAKSLMFPQHRRHFRWRLHRSIRISFDGHHELEAVVVDISVGGIAVQMSRQVEVDQRLHVRLQLPGHNDQMEVKGEVAWADNHGRAGIRFVQLPKTSHNKIREWLDSASTGGRSNSRLPERARPAGRF